VRFRSDVFVSLLERLYNLFSENRATGVAYALNPLLHPDGPKDTRIVRGTKLVLVSAGTFGSPGILERSGIGAKDVLERVGVKQRVDLPGVGENYQGFPLQCLSRTLVSDVLVSSCRPQ
jgi:choline dehydrogenase-like flavoprotein